MNLNYGEQLFFHVSYPYQTAELVAFNPRSANKATQVTVVPVYRQSNQLIKSPATKVVRILDLYPASVKG